jgi:hypothetical protein
MRNPPASAALLLSADAGPLQGIRMIWLGCGVGAIALALIVHSWLEQRAYKRWVAEHRLYRRDDEITAYLQMHER